MQENKPDQDMKITVLTPDKEVFEGTIVSVKVPGVKGQFQVLKNHAPIVSALEEGQVEIVTAEGEYRFFNDETGELETASESGRKLIFHITGGFVEVLNNNVSLLIQGVNKKIL
jgi:F-type H+-transporting ATPase subunit epsilon